MLRTILGVLLAAVFAGPLTVLLVTIFIMMTGSTRLPSPGIADLPDVAKLVGIAVLVGFVPALLGSALVTVLLRTAQKHWAAARHPLAWAVTGFVLAFLFPWAVSRFFMPMNNGIVFCVTGSICALICWRFQRDASPVR